MSYLGFYVILLTTRLIHYKNIFMGYLNSPLVPYWPRGLNISSYRNQKLRNSLYEFFTLQFSPPSSHFLLRTLCVSYIFLRNYRSCNCDVRQPTNLMRKPLGDNSMSVKSGLDSKCCRLAWRVRSYRVKPRG